MERLFTLDEKNYSDDLPIFERFAVRAIICKDGKYATQQSKFGDYKLPGGGMEKGETREQALIREVREETGLIVKPESIREIGEILEKRIDFFDPNQIFVAHSYFFFCDVEEDTVEVKMTQSEVKLGYHPAWATLEDFLSVNQNYLRDYWQKRDYKFMKWLQDRNL